MSQEPDFILTNLLTNKPLEVTDNTAVLPLFATNLYTIKASVNKPGYTKKYRKSVRWDFGDGTIKEGASAEHYYNTPGKYRISCTFYNIDRKPHESKYYINVIVKEIIPINLEFVDITNEDLYPTSGPKEIYRSKLNNLLTLQSTLNNNVKVLAPIKPVRVDINEGNSYFKIKNNKYYHLERYYTFLKEESDFSYKKNINSHISLKPTEYFIPKYSPLYISFENEDGLIKPRVFVYLESSQDIVDLPSTFKIYNPNTSVLKNHLKSEDDYYFTADLERIYYFDNLPKDSRFCGWISRFNIWYKDDYAGEKEIYFSYDTTKLEFYDNTIDPSTINIPQLGLKINVKDSEDYSYALTSNGLLFSSEIKNDLLMIDNYLKHNLYTDYKVECYLAKYIKNDVYDWADNGEEKITWSILKDTDNIALLSGTKCKVEKDDSYNEYINRYEIMPTSNNFTLSVAIADDKSYEYNHVNGKALYGIRLPYKKYTYIDFDRMLNSYMQHSMYEDKPLIRAFFKQIFETDELFENINNKGFDFFDDIVNHKTCYIKNLQSILEMFGASEMSYNINSFDKINELKELVRILSMQYTTLFGRFETMKNDITIIGDQKGKDVGDEIKSTDIIVCTAEYTVIGIIRDGNYYPCASTKHLILHTPFNNETRLVNFYGIKSHLKPLNHETLANEYGAAYYYNLNDYNYSWGWNLQLPAESEKMSNLGNIIDTYYTLYLYKETQPRERKYNYLDNDAIPYSQEPYTSFMTKKEWEDVFGYTYDCLMKVLIYKLGLN